MCFPYRMDDTKLTLSRGDFNVFSGTTFTSLFEDGDLSDVTLACADHKQIHAHKIILSSGSEFFKNLIFQNPHPHPLVYLQLPYKDLLAIVRFIYQGECQVEQGRIHEFLHTAKQLSVTGLVVDSKSNIDNISKKTDIPENKAECYDESKYKDDHAQKELEFETIVNDLTESPVVEEEEEIINKSLSLNKYDDKTHIDEELTFRFSCDICHFTTKTSKLLKRHKDSHDGVISYCDMCNFTSTRKSLSKAHIAKSHKQKSHNCEKCSFEAYSYIELNKHAQETHALVQDVKTCSECGHQASCEALLD